MTTKKDERLSCKMLVGLLERCNTCWNFEYAFPSPFILEMLNHKGIVSLDTPEITSSVEHLLSLL